MIGKCQGGFVVGDRDGAFQKVANEIEEMIRGSSVGISVPSNTQTTTVVGTVLLPSPPLPPSSVSGTVVLPPPLPATMGHNSSPMLRRSHSGISAVPSGPTSLTELQASLESKEREIGILKAILVAKDMQIDELKIAGLRL